MVFSLDLITDIYNSTSNEEAYIKYRNLILRSAKYMDQLIDFKYKGRLRNLKALFMGIQTNLLAINTLLDSTLNYATESLILGRSIVEKVINLSYLCICEDENYQRFQDYSIKKAHFSSRKNINIDGLNIEVKPKSYSESTDDLADHLKNAVKNLEKKNPNKWHPNNLTLDKRLDTILGSGLIKGLLLKIAYNYIYDDGSEATHGTIHGILKSTNILNSLTSIRLGGQSVIDNEIASTVFVLLLNLSYTIHEMLSFIYEVEKLEDNSIEAIKVEANTIFELIMEIAEMESSKNGDESSWDICITTKEGRIFKND